MITYWKVFWAVNKIIQIEAWLCYSITKMPKENIIKRSGWIDDGGYMIEVRTIKGPEPYSSNLILDKPENIGKFLPWMDKNTIIDEELIPAIAEARAKLRANKLNRILKNGNTKY